MIQDLYSTLQNDSGLTAIFGSAVYNTLPPDGTTAPYIIFQAVDEAPLNNLASSSARRMLFQVDCFCTTVAQAESAWLALKAATDTSYVIQNVDRVYNPVTNQFRLAADLSSNANY